MTAASSIVIADASVLINLIHVERLDLLGALAGYTFRVPDVVVADEVTYPAHRDALRRALEAGCVADDACEAPGELTLYSDLKQTIDKGEAACLAIGHVRGWIVACDERGRFSREARRLLGDGRVLNTPGLLLMAIRQDLLTVVEADQAKDVLESRRFLMRFRSFRDLL